MNDTLPAWFESVQKCLADLQSPPAGEEGRGRLLAAMSELGTLLSRYRTEMPADLAHFLERRSYAKAAQFCAGAQAITRGSCGGKK
jgi:hypothetical protein